MNRAARIAALILVCAGCAHAPPGQAPAPTADAYDHEVPAPGAQPAPAAPPTPQQPGDLPAAPRLASIRTAVDRRLTAQAKALWDAWTRGTPPDLESFRSDPLASPETLAFVRECRDRAQGDERLALSLLHAFLVGEHLSAEAAPAEARPAAVPWEGRSVPGAHVPGLLAAEPDAGRRAELERAWVGAQRRRGAADNARWDSIAAAARRIGYDSLLGLAADLRGQRIDDLAALARGVLEATDAPYRALLQALARSELGKDLAGVRGRDLPRMLRAGEDARAFSADRASTEVGETLGALGLDVAGRPGVVLDLEPRPRKDPRALALPVDVPGDVRVSFSPKGGAAELRALLHEMGAATFYVHVKSKRLEFRRLGTVTAESWAFLFEDLAGDPAWLAERTSLSESHVAPMVRAVAARRLHAARALAARILVEIARQREPAKARDTAKAVLETAFARAVEPDELDLFLAERDPLLEAADGLRAILLAAQAEAFLARRAGGSWWRSKESGAWLAAAFAEGSRRTPAELARSFGAEAVDAAALAASSRARALASGVRLAEAGQRCAITAGSRPSAWAESP